MQELNCAIHIILDYIKKLENEIHDTKVKQNYINIQNKISQNTFWILKSYYSDTYNINIEWNDLKCMSFEMLYLLNYETLRLYRGFGVKSEIKLKQLLQPYISFYEEKIKLNELI